MGSAYIVLVNGVPLVALESLSLFSSEDMVGVGLGDIASEGTAVSMCVCARMCAC